jgi:hypothetical protein
MSDQTIPPMPGGPPPPPDAPSSTKKPIWKRWWAWAAAIVALLIIAGALGSKNTTNQASATPSQTQTEQPQSPSSTGAASPPSTPASAHSFGDGTYIVGKDIQAGTYRAPSAGSSCYWERDKNFSGGLDSILANGNGISDTAPLLVTILKTDKGFTTQDCGNWTSDLSQVTQSKTSFGDGIFIVGVDIAPGTYRTNAPDGCYWERMRNFIGDLNSILANNNTKGSTIVEIRAGDSGFESDGCGTWSRV